MKYMTKEWYETMQKSDLHLLLRVSARAEAFSEDYYRELYRREEKKWLKLQKEVSEVRFDDIFGGEFEDVFVDASELLNEAEIEQAKQEYNATRERARTYFENQPPFDPEEERKNFRRSMLDNMKILKKKLPEEILRKVADLRVLALNYASAEVKREITKYCKQNEKQVRLAMDAYHKQYQKQFQSKVPAFAEELSLHDCEVLSCRKKGRDVLLTLDHSGGFTIISKIRMKNCKLIKQDAPLHGACCLYEEIYKVGERYEIHFLLLKKQLIDYIVSVDDLEYEYDGVGI